MYQVDICMFHEPEEASIHESSLPREWGEFRKMNEFETVSECVAYCEFVAKNHRGEFEEIVCGEMGYDGFSIDVREKGPNPYIVSYEMQPGRNLDVWHDEECHEPLEVTE